MAESASGVALEVAEVALLEAYIDGKGGLGRHMHGSKRACNEIPARRRGEKGGYRSSPSPRPLHTGCFVRPSATCSGPARKINNIIPEVEGVPFSGQGEGTREISGYPGRVLE